MISPQHLLTNNGDLAVALPVAAFVAGWAWVNHRRRVALAFAGCCLATIVLCTAVKLPFHVAAPPPDAAALWEFSSGAPSGHAAIAGAIYGCALLIFLRLGRGAARSIGAVYCAAIALGVAVTRVTLLTHTAADVAAGALLAGLFIAAFDRVLSGDHGAPAPTRGLLIGMMLTAVLAQASGLSVTSDSFL